MMLVTIDFLGFHASFSCFASLIVKHPFEVHFRGTVPWSNLDVADELRPY
jgi:hypothetical protein